MDRNDLNGEDLHRSSVAGIGRHPYLDSIHAIHAQYLHARARVRRHRIGLHADLDGAHPMGPRSPRPREGRARYARPLRRVR